MKKILVRISVSLGAVAVILIGIYYLSPGAVLGVIKQVMRWNAGVESRAVTVDDHRWPYLEGGTGETVLLLHGFGADRDLWGTLLPALTASYRVIAPDLPGFGGNSRIAGADYGIPAQAGRVHAFARKIGLERFYLMGHSMGGAIAAQYAGEHPERVKGLVLMSSFGLRTPAVSDGERELLRGNRFLVYRDAAQFDTTMGMIMLDPPRLPGHIKRYIARLGAENYEFHGKIFDALSADGADFLRPRLSKIASPTLVLWGDKDRIFDASIAHEYGRAIRSCRVVVVPGSGHMVFLERPAESIAAVNGFLGDVK